jgi:D-alanyl-D-alanine carboxypeptidase
MPSPSLRIPFLAALLIPLMVPQGLTANDPLDLSLAGTTTIATSPGMLYQPMVSNDAETWRPSGPWFVGTGASVEVRVPYTDGATYLRVDTSAVSDISQQLEQERASIGVPGLAVAVIREGQLAAYGVTGNRRFGTTSPVTLDDKWHHGSNTKSMTATLAAIMVEKGFIGWETTLGDVFPSVGGAWAGVTLKQLLANASGAPGDLVSSGIWSALWSFYGLPTAARSFLLNEVTDEPLRFTPGSGYEYSNAGFALAGHMLETVAGTPWEALLVEHLFTPLGITSAGFGIPATPHHIDQPIGHGGAVNNPVIGDPQRGADNPAAFGPAGTVHANLLDSARYVQAHLKGERGEETTLLPTAQWRLLHEAAFGNGYALGWSVFDRPWAGGTALNHNGSNTQWHSTMWIAPARNWAVVVCMNFGGDDAFSKSDTIVGWALSNYGP